MANRLDKEFKIAFSLLIFLLVLTAGLLKIVAKISPFSLEFLAGYIPFAVLVAPYILFSSDSFKEMTRSWVSRSNLRKLILPLIPVIVYALFALLQDRFSYSVFLNIFLWYYVPTSLWVFTSTQDSRFFYKEFFVALCIWLPYEFGLLSGFDIIFNKGIQIPALPFAAPILGLYLFAILKNLPDIGYHFRWKPQDLLYAFLGLVILTCLLIPLGIGSGFISFSNNDFKLALFIQTLFGIYFLNALPEELLFRGIIQNLLKKSMVQHKYSTAISLGIASVIFGLSHWNNHSPTDWRYVYLATLAGGVYGWVYLKSGKTTVSAIVHTGVNVTWVTLFGLKG